MQSSHCQCFIIVHYIMCMQPCVRCYMGLIIVTLCAGFAVKAEKGLTGGSSEGRGVNAPFPSWSVLGQDTLPQVASGGSSSGVFVHINGHRSRWRPACQWLGDGALCCKAFRVVTENTKGPYKDRPHTIYFRIWLRTVLDVRWTVSFYVRVHSPHQLVSVW